MDIKVDIDSAAVEKQLVEAIMKAGIGEQITKAIDKTLTTKIGNYYDSKTLVELAVYEAVKVQIGLMVQATILEKRDFIKGLLAEKLTDAILGDFVSAAWTAVDDALGKKR